MDGTATVGVATKYAREDHIHPSDTSRAPLASPTFTGDPKAPTPTAGDNDTSIATTAFVTAAGAAITTAYQAADTTLTTSVNSKVAKAGDTMTGSLTVKQPAAHNFIYLDKDSSAYANAIQSKTAGVQHWQLNLGGGGAADDVALYSYNDSGASIGTPLSIVRTTGKVTLGGSGGGLDVSGDINSTRPGAPTTGVLFFGNSGTKYLYYDGTQYNLNQASLVVGNGISFNGDTGLSSSSSGMVFGTPNQGGFVFRPYGAGNATNQISMFLGGNLLLSGSSAYLGTTNGVNGGFQSKLGTSNVANTGNYWNYWYEGSNGLMYVCVNNTQLGTMNISSDYRIKKDVLPLPSMWDTVKALKPIKYTHTQFTPPSELERTKETQRPFMAGDDAERWGFIAHEVQETTIATASSAAKDAPDAIQDLNLAPIVAALTKALQEAMSRIEVLEAA
jgi:Chaperone of endosialidase